MEDSESKIRKVLLSDAGLVISVCIGVFGFFNFIVKPQYEVKTDIKLIQQSIDTIQKNHEVHIQDILEQIKDIKAREIDIEKQHSEIHDQFIKILK